MHFHDESVDEIMVTNSQNCLCLCSFFETDSSGYQKYWLISNISFQFICFLLKVLSVGFLCLQVILTNRNWYCSGILKMTDCKTWIWVEVMWKVRNLEILNAQEQHSWLICSTPLSWGSYLGISEGETLQSDHGQRSSFPHYSFILALTSLTPIWAQCLPRTRDLWFEWGLTLPGSSACGPAPLDVEFASGLGTVGANWAFHLRHFFLARLAYDV